MLRQRIFRNGVLPSLIYLLGFIVLTWPVIQSFSSHFIADAGDGLQNVWNIWWVNQAICELGVLPWHTEFLHYPEGVTLIGHTLNPLNGLIGIVLGWFLSPEQVFNTIVVFSFVSTGLCCFWLARYFKDCFWTALLAGFAFTFSSFHFAHAYGHMQLVSLEGLPLFLLLWLRFLDRPSHGRGLGASAALLLTLLCDLYYAFYAILAGALFFVYRSARSGDLLVFLRKRNLPALASFTLSANLYLLPFLLSLLAANRDDPFVGVHNAYAHGLDLFAPFVPGASWALASWTEGFWGQLSGNPIETSVYLRWTILVPALYAVLRSRALGLRDEFAWVILGLMFGLFSLGPLLHVFGEDYPSVPMPYNALVWLVPPLEVSGMPVRMVVMLMLSVCLLAPAALPILVAHVPLRLRPIALAIYLGLFLFETWPYELPTTRIPEPDYVAALRELPPGGVAGLDGEPISLLQQTRFEKPMALGYVSRLPTSLAKRKANLTALHAGGSFREFLVASGCRYLLLDKFAAAPGPPGLKRVRLTHHHDVFVLSEDALPAIDVPARDCASGAEVEVLVERPGDGTAPQSMQILAPADAGRRYLIAFSLGAGPGTALADGRQVPLDADALYEATRLKGNQTFIGNHGVLDQEGKATITLRLDRQPELAGQKIYYCVAIYDPRAPSGICRVGGTGSFVY